MFVFVLLFCIYLRVLSLRSLFFTLSLKSGSGVVSDFSFFDVVLFSVIFVFLLFFYISKKIIPF